MTALYGIFQLILAFFLAVPQILGPIPALINEAAYFEDWSKEQAYTEDYAIVLEKDENEDFVVLNLADVQISDDENYYAEYEYAKDMITKLVNDTDPDLITLTGDNAWDTVSYVTLVDFIDSLGIPWAPVMGNHDGQGCMSEFWVAYLLDEAENCLFQFGPKDMGYGNYIINITENGKIIHTFFMMDTHNNNEYELEDGTVVSAYDHLWPNQLEWYEWAVKGIAKIAGYTVPSTVVMHIPVVEYLDAWVLYTGDEDYMGEISELTGREYRPFDYYGDPEAENIIIAMGSVTETIKETIDYLAAQGKKVGVMIVRLYRPFSAKYFSLTNVLIY